MGVAKDSSPTGVFLALVHRFLCVPLILRQFRGLVGNAAEKLLLAFPTLDRKVKIGDFDASDKDKVELVVHRPIAFCWRMFLDRKMGLAEAYLAGDWDASPGPKDLLTLLIRARKAKTPSKSSRRNRRSIPGVLLALLGKAVKKVVFLANLIQHRCRQNTISQSQKNIHDHYDLGNDMFELFLDDSMTYSCGIFEGSFPVKVEKPDKKALEAAQMRKYDALLERLAPKSTDHVLEIGCGWGACAIRAVQKYNCRWTGLTISEQQFALASERVQQAGLADKIEIKFLDYRKETGRYDKLVAVEMIEAVGHEYLPTFFATIDACLKPSGVAVLQAILCLDDQYERYRKSTDFIKKHIFPGGHLPALAAITAALPPTLTFDETNKVRHIGLHYAVTLDHWNAAWLTSRRRILALGYSNFFFRKWEFYFALCSALFEHGNIDATQLSLVKASA